MHLLSLLLGTFCLQAAVVKSQGSYNLMVVGGDPAEFQVEVVDLDNAAAVCPQINIYPLPDGSVGTFINGHAMVCGGYFEEDECYKYDKVNNEWVLDEYMNYGRRFASAIKLSTGEWWITGSFFTSSGPTTEVYRIGEGFTITEPLPDHKYYHTLIELDPTHIMLVGGSSTRNTWIFDTVSRNWNKSVELLHPRYRPMAGSIRTSDGDLKVVVVGGNNDNTTEIFFDGEWTLGPTLPVTELYGGASVQMEDTFLVIGGYIDLQGEQTSIFKFDVANMEWIKIDPELSQPRQNFAAFLIPKSYITCS